MGNRSVRVGRHSARIGAALLGLFLLGLFSAPSAAEDAECKDETPDPSSNTPYRRRGGLCEGMYLKRYAASVVPQSLTLGDVSVGKADQTLTIKWDAPPVGNQLDLVVRNLKCEPSYQMRTDVNAASGSFAWPPTIPVQHAINSLGVQARTSEGDYLPARTGTSSNSEYRIAFCASDPLVNVWIKVYDSKDQQIHSVALKKTKAGSIEIGVPVAEIKPHARYRVTLTSGAISTGFSFEVP
jgi:hypothetical protein